MYIYIYRSLKFVVCKSQPLNNEWNPNSFRRKSFETCHQSRPEQQTSSNYPTNTTQLPATSFKPHQRHRFVVIFRHKPDRATHTHSTLPRTTFPLYPPIVSQQQQQLLESSPIYMTTQSVYIKTKVIRWNVQGARWLVCSRRNYSNVTHPNAALGHTCVMAKDESKRISTIRCCNIASMRCLTGDAPACSHIVYDRPTQNTWLCLSLSLSPSGLVYYVCT